MAVDGKRRLPWRLFFFGVLSGVYIRNVLVMSRTMQSHFEEENHTTTNTNTSTNANANTSTNKEEDPSLGGEAAVVAKDDDDPLPRRAYLSSNAPYSGMTPHLDVIWARGWYNVLHLPLSPTPLSYHNAPGLGQHALSMGVLSQYFSPDQCGMIWLRTHDLPAWTDNVLSRSTCSDGNITLITSDHYIDIPTGLRRGVASTLFNSSKIAAWYSTNQVQQPQHDEPHKLFPIPLGLPIHYGFDGSPHSAHTVQTMERLRRDAPPFHARNRTVLLDVGTMSGGNQRRSAGRQLAKDKLLQCPKGRVEIMPRGGPLESWPRYAAHQFAIAPVGVGYDTYRFWEYVFFGTVPIVISSPLDSMLMDAHVPCVIVKDWNEICLWTEKDYDAMAHKYEKWIAKGSHWLSPSLWVPRNQKEMNRLCTASPGCEL
eukprot:CAMPEP_0195306674 /NCGR_PEP_ID=MMETSP0707-20130614/37313_1 /TAXON_ID=33640 /ORGANISM="Asterionellopsis glacialis, Strain CCMP134" /LENGTH=425 /DNA_ID=CAMNT_0040370895 /DNA_START=39 /DNA_END=1316 /DNA_ORIENTATION=+